MITADLVLQRVKTLPSLPTTVVALGEIIADERCTVDRVLEVLSKDPPLSASILRMANSPAFASEKNVSDLRTALMRLGMGALLTMGRSAAVIRTLRSAEHLDAQQLWGHSVAVGLTAKAICRLLRRRSEEESAFLAGLLHDIGKIALDRCFTKDYAPVVSACREGAFTVEAERRLLGITHMDVGALVAESWHFPEGLVSVIREHHTPPPGAFLSHLIHLSDLLVRTRIPSGPADETLVFVLAEHPSFLEVFKGAALEQDMERLTFQIDDEVEHAVTFVQLAFQD